jgi:hypothetical protein
MTPRAFYALLDRYRRARRHELYCAAVTASAVYNVNRDPKKHPEPIGPEDLIGSEPGNAPAKPNRQSADDMLLIVRGVLNPMLGGIEIPNNTNG